MDTIDKNTKHEEIRDKMQPLAKKLMDTLRESGMIPHDSDNFFMMDGELTHEQRESKVPIGTKGYYRMYRWECQECNEVGKKMPYSEMHTDAIKHYEQTKHKMVERGGVFPKKEMYTY